MPVQTKRVSEVLSKVEKFSEKDIQAILHGTKKLLNKKNEVDWDEFLAKNHVKLCKIRDMAKKAFPDAEGTRYEKEIRGDLGFPGVYATFRLSIDNIFYPYPQIDNVVIHMPNNVKPDMAEYLRCSFEDFVYDNSGRIFEEVKDAFAKSNKLRTDITNKINDLFKKAGLNFGLHPKYRGNIASLIGDL